MIFVVMKHLWKYGLLLCVCISCEYINGFIVKEEVIVAEEKKSINLDTVDEFPSFQSCDSLEKEAQKGCFFQILTDEVYTRLSTNDLTVTAEIQDTIQVSLQIDTLGIIKIDNIRKSELTSVQLPQLDSLLHKSIINLPKTSPAYKRGFPVTTKFVLPIILHVEK